VLLSASVSAQPAPAPAQGATSATAGAPRDPTPEELEEAKRSFESGVKFFNVANYEAARASFEAAYKLSRFPALLYNLGKTAEKQNQRRDAIRFLEQYMQTNPQDAAEVEAKLRELRRAEGLPEDGSQPVPPAQPQPAGMGQSKLLVGTQKMPPIPSLVLLGTGAAFLIAGIGCGAGAITAAREVENGNGKPYAGEVSAAFTRGRTLSDAAIALDVIGGAMLAGGGAWLGYWIYKKNKHPETLPQASLIWTGSGLGVAGRF
jgi:tetratricopeptide (TPR) repeat protein